MSESQSSTQVKQGDVLIAPPSMPDPRFKAAVILVAQHGEEGTMGFCLNKMSRHSLLDLLRSEGLEGTKDWPLYWGGPVGSSTVWMLHTNEWSMDHTWPIDDYWSITTHQDMFGALDSGDCPKEFRIIIGHCGWMQGQLELELEGQPPRKHNHSWLVLQDPEPGLITDVSEDDLWDASLDQCGHQAIDHWL